MANVSKGRSAGGFLRDRMWRIYPLWWVAVIPWLFFLPRGVAIHCLQPQPVADLRRQLLRASGCRSAVDAQLRASLRSPD